MLNERFNVCKVTGMVFHCHGDAGDLTYIVDYVKIETF